MSFICLQIVAVLVLCVHGVRHQGFTTEIDFDHRKHETERANLTRSIFKAPDFAEETHGSASLAQTAFEVRKLFLLSQAGRSKVSDPYVLASAVAISTVSNIATIIVSQSRVSGLKNALHNLQNLQDQMFDDHDSDCFNVRALEVQADLFCRGIEALTDFARQELLSKATKITITPSIPAPTSIEVSPSTEDDIESPQIVQSTGVSACCCRKMRPSESCQQRKAGLTQNYLTVKSNGDHFCCKNQTKPTCGKGPTVFGQNKYQHNLESLGLQEQYDKYCLETVKSLAVSRKTAASSLKASTTSTTTVTTKMSDVEHHDEGSWNSLMTSMWHRMPWSKHKSKATPSTPLKSLTEEDLLDAQDDVSEAAPPMLQSEALDPAMREGLLTVKENSARALEALTKNVRQAMGSAVHSACHKFEGGEMVLQTGIQSLELRLKDAQDQALKAVMDLVQHLTLLFVLIPRPPSPPSPPPSAGSTEAFGTEELTLSVQNAQAIMVVLSNPEVATFQCFPPAYQPMLRATSVALARLLNIVVALSTTASMLTITLVTTNTLARILSGMNDAFGWISKVGSCKACQTMTFEMLDVVDSSIAVVSLVDAFLNLMGGPVATVLLAHALVLLDTLQSLLKMSKAVLELQKDKIQISEVTAAAKNSQVSSKLIRSFETCTALSTAWSLTRTASDLVIPFESELSNLPGHEEIFAQAKQRAFEDLIAYRPGIARIVLSRALKQGHVGVTPELVERTKMIAENAPITDLAMTKKYQDGFRRLGFTDLPPADITLAPTNFFVCRGCSNAAILAIVEVKSAAHSEQLARAFKEDPPKVLLGEEQYILAPEDSTLSFVQIKFESDLRMIAFLKAPLASLKGNPEILFDLRFQQLQMSVETGIRKGLRMKDAEAWQAKLRQLLRDTGKSIVFSASEFIRADHWTAGSGSLKETNFRWFQSSFTNVQANRNITKMLPYYRIRPLKYLTVTRGCGCVIGPLNSLQSSMSLLPNVHYIQQLKMSANLDPKAKKIDL
jgi:hypothetical protein